MHLDAREDGRKPTNPAGFSPPGVESIPEYTIRELEAVTWVAMLG